MTQTEQVLAIAKQVEDKVGTLSTITNLKQCLDDVDVIYLDKSEWEELISCLERYYIISDVKYPFEIVKNYLDIIN